MNRKKAIVLLAMMEAMLIPPLIILYMNGLIGVYGLMSAILALSILTTGIMFVIFKKTDPM